MAKFFFCWLSVSYLLEVENFHWYDVRFDKEKNKGQKEIEEKIEWEYYFNIFK